MWHWLHKVFGSAGAIPAEPARLSAASEERLSSSLRTLPHGERGWITIAEAAQLFSPMEQEYAFGEMDDEGRLRLAEFAAASRCEPRFMKPVLCPAELRDRTGISVT
jgi:hypothetical protein